MLSRRHLLSLTGSLAAMSVVPTRLTLAGAQTEARFVLVIQRGAMDGLHAAPPYADPHYRATRGNLALADDGGLHSVLDLDGRFGLHPRLTELKSWYDRDELLAVHAVATPYRDRSHFDGQDLLESGGAEPRSVTSGWLNRTIAAMGGDRPLGLSLGGELPLILRGAAPVASWAPLNIPAASPSLLALVESMYAKQPGLEAMLQQGIEADQMAAKAIDRSSIGIVRPIDAPRVLAEAGGKLLAQSNGPRIAVLELHGWDTHVGQGLSETGRMLPALSQMNDAFAALKAALDSVWSCTVVLTATEFGRTARPNGAGGTDHGTATALFLGGGAIEGGRVIANWPGLGQAQLYQNRDLAPTIDFRSVAKAVLHGHLGLPQEILERLVFPHSESAKPTPDLLRA